jgi:hypothetical protein
MPNPLPAHGADLADDDHHLVGLLGRGNLRDKIKRLAAATWAMMGLGFAGPGFLGYRRNKAASTAGPTTTPTL